LVLKDFGVERSFETVACSGHHFCAQGNTDVDAAIGNLVRDILGGFETGGAEAVYGGGSGGVGEASCKSSGANEVCGPSIVDLGLLLGIADSANLE
jgi:hypothetical protein